MPNINCLEGMACPKCESEEPFEMVVMVSTLMYDMGSEDVNHSEWDDTSYCRCEACGFEGIVADFTNDYTPTIIDFGGGETITVNVKGSMESTLDHGRKGSKLDAALNAFESLILALVCANVPIDEKFIEGAQSAYEAIANNLGD